MTTKLKLWFGALFGIAALAWGFISRGRTINNLKVDLALQPGQLETTRLKEVTDETSKKSDIDSANYNDLKRANAELAAKLGISGPDSSGDS